MKIGNLRLDLQVRGVCVCESSESCVNVCRLAQRSATATSLHSIFLNWHIARSTSCGKISYASSIYERRNRKAPHFWSFLRILTGKGGLHLTHHPSTAAMEKMFYVFAEFALLDSSPCHEATCRFRHGRLEEQGVVLLDGAVFVIT